MLILALDKMSLAQATELLGKLPASLNFFKISDLGDASLANTIKKLRLWWDNNRNYSEKHKFKIWVDWKLHDTPDTVKERAVQIKNAGAYATSVHACDGPRPVQAVKDSGLYTIAILVLSSLSDNEIRNGNNGMEPGDVLIQRANWARIGNADAIVCPPRFVSILRQWQSHFNPLERIPIIVPGTRSFGSPAHDQRQILTPEVSIENGADYLVLGREVTQALYPEGVIDQILRDTAPAVTKRKQANTWRMQQNH